MVKRAWVKSCLLDLESIYFVLQLERTSKTGSGGVIAALTIRRKSFFRNVFFSSRRYSFGTFQRPRISLIGWIRRIPVLNRCHFSFCFLVYLLWEDGSRTWVLHTLKSLFIFQYTLKFHRFIQLFPRIMILNEGSNFQVVHQLVLRLEVHVQLFLLLITLNYFVIHPFLLFCSVNSCLWVIFYLLLLKLHRQFAVHLSHKGVLLIVSADQTAGPFLKMINRLDLVEI